MSMAILVDGGYYRKRVASVYGVETPRETADRLYNYCFRHLKEKIDGKDVRNDLYRIFYYDCPPIDKIVYHPGTHKQVDFSRTDTKQWAEEFYDVLAHKRKVALRFGEINESSIHFQLKDRSLRKVLDGKLAVSDVQETDFTLSMQQKGVDMRIGLDIASLSFKKQVNSIVLIAGDSDFVPAAKLARREGVDFILDSLGRPIKENLSLHIDGLRTCDSQFSSRPDKKVK
ncbi:nuclease [Alloscardovia macacae]|uniref:Nuclease n=1 Tax=Alloscardovia macacae TaxID=1160091 RepID=A0A1Y2STP7_9BIFI|nr:NYN domain-containing protein [Alloscardovia macacae]OTA26368.1 nuclease [Alloscardovia macacae]OTA28826.1 nuclease [Alloscardovia macacae]